MTVTAKSAPASSTATDNGMSVTPWAVPPGSGNRRMKIDAVTAAGMLERNRRNRALVPSHVEAIENDLLSSRWHYNGDSIRFDESGALIDGQHRLTAVVRTGVPIDSMVIWGLPDSVMSTIDTNRARRGRDVLSMAGENHPVGLAAALRLIACYSDNDLSMRRVTNTELLDTLAAHPEVRACVATAHAEDMEQVGRRSVMSFCYWLFSRKEPTAAHAFIRSIGVGADLSETDPRFILRRYLSLRGTRLSVSDSSARPIAAMYIKAWNAWRSGKQLGVVKFATSESFPVPR